jgi:hypothetical protein
MKTSAKSGFVQHTATRISEYENVPHSYIVIIFQWKKTAKDKNCK